MTVISEFSCQNVKPSIYFPSLNATMFQHKADEASFLNTKASKDCRFALPGFGRPLDFAPMEKDIYGVESRSMFPSALDDRDIEAGNVE